MICIVPVHGVGPPAGVEGTKGCLFIKGEGGGWQRFFEPGHLSERCVCVLCPKEKVPVPRKLGHL